MSKFFFLTFLIVGLSYNNGRCQTSKKTTSIDELETLEAIKNASTNPNEVNDYDEESLQLEDEGTTAEEEIESPTVVDIDETESIIEPKDSASTSTQEYLKDMVEEIPTEPTTDDNLSPATPY